MKTNNSDILDDLLDSITPLEQAKIDAKMVIAAKIADAMKEKGWKNKDLLDALKKENPSVVTKWLSGTQNFTVDTLVELEQVLNIKLLDLGDKKNEVVINFHIGVSQHVNSGNVSNYCNENTDIEKRPKLVRSYGYSVKSKKYNESTCVA